MKWKGIGIAVSAGLLGLGGVACGSGGDGDQDAAGPDNQGTSSASGQVPAPDDGRTVTIKLIAFKPTQIEVTAGETVTWRQEDVATHTVTSGRVEQAGGTATAKPDGTFDSGNISKGQAFEFKFPAAGEFPFFCAIHPATMTGLVTVT